MFLPPPVGSMVQDRERHVSDWALMAGSGGGIGRAVVDALLATGTRVVGYDRFPSRDPRLAGEIEAAGASRKAVRAALAPTLAELGAPAIGVVCLGTYRRIPFADYDDETFDEIFADNFKAAFWIAQALVEAMAPAGAGRVILVCSQAAATGAADAAYAAAKAATVALGKSLARDYGPSGLRINVVAPGPVHTPMSAGAMSPERMKFYEDQIPIRRFSSADEVAAVIAFLATGPCGSVNGATFDVDGGLVRR